MSQSKFSWEHAIIDDVNLQAPTRHVLLTLAVFMNRAGESCFPSIETLVQKTGLSKKTVIKHISLAVEAGYLSKKLHGYKGQKWRRLEYVACFPDSGLQGTPCTEKGGVTDTPAFYDEGGVSDSEGGVSKGQKVVEEIHQYNNIPKNRSENRPVCLAREHAPTEPSGLKHERDDSFTLQPPAPDPKAKQKKPKNPVKTALPVDFIPPKSWQEFAIKKGLTPAEAGQEWPKFRDHHTAKANRFADWDAAWRNWIRQALEIRDAKAQRMAR